MTTTAATSPLKITTVSRNSQPASPTTIPAGRSLFWHFDFIFKIIESPPSSFIARERSICVFKVVSICCVYVDVRQRCRLSTTLLARAACAHVSSLHHRVDTTQPVWHSVLFVCIYTLSNSLKPTNIGGVIAPSHTQLEKETKLSGKFARFARQSI